MRDFFKTIILNLYVYCGNRQAEKMTTEEIKMLLDALVKVSKLYSYISEEDQKRIIEKCLIEDKEYMNINARVISKWLETNGKKYFTEEAHKESTVYEPATEEQRAFWLKQWEAELAKVNTNFEIRPISQGELIRESLRENLKSENEKPYTKLSTDDVERRERHKMYLKHNYDPSTGNALETWIPEDEWLKNNF